MLKLKKFYPVAQGFLTKLEGGAPGDLDISWDTGVVGSERLLEAGPPITGHLMC